MNCTRKKLGRLHPGESRTKRCGNYCFAATGAANHAERCRTRKFITKSLGATAEMTPNKT
jgi:hypothetical protein